MSNLGVLVIKQVAKDGGISVGCLAETWLEDDPIELRRLRTEGYQVLERARPPKPEANLEPMRFPKYGHRLSSTDASRRALYL
jgi:hypothetical protein